MAPETNVSSRRDAAPAHDGFRTPLAEKVFLDRYALKATDRDAIREGDVVVYCPNPEAEEKRRRREIGIVTAVRRDTQQAEARPRDEPDGPALWQPLDHLDKPLELHPEQMYRRVARAVAAVEPTDEARSQAEERFFRVMAERAFVPGGRILAGAGVPGQLTFYNCFVLPSPHDSRRGIMATATQQLEIMSRGGGVGINVSSLRPRFDSVEGVNGRSSGAVSWADFYSILTGKVEQGGSRRGALMIILDDWHPDIEQFVEAKHQIGTLDNANISVAVSDAFMEAVERDTDWPLVFPDRSEPDYDTAWDGDLDKWRRGGKRVNVYRTVKARHLYDRVCASAWASAEPGLFFVDRVNALSNSYYYQPIRCTNPCITGDTRIYTADGLIPARDLFESQDAAAVVVDSRFGGPMLASACAVIRTGVKEVYRLQTKEGYSLRATADHRLMTPNGWVALGDLGPGDRVHILGNRGGFGTEGSLELGRTLGWIIGDGTIKKDKAVLSFYGEEKRTLAPLFAAHVAKLVSPLTRAPRHYSVSVIDVEGTDEARVASARLLRLTRACGLHEVKHRVPEAIFRGNEAMQAGFLQALFTADGSFQGSRKKGGSVRLASNHLPLLEGVQLLLLNFGIASRIYRNRRKAGFRNMPDSKRQLRAYWCADQHELAVSKQGLSLFARSIGFLMPYKQEGLERYLNAGKRGVYRERFEATVEAITADGVEDVYDLTEPSTHSFVANGIVVHNCGEQPLPPWGVCNLGALNLAAFCKPTPEGKHFWPTAGEEQAGDRRSVLARLDLERLAEAARAGAHFLDCVIDVTPYFFEENAAQQRAERRVGLGVMGLAELLIRMGVPYGSPRTLEVVARVFEVIRDAAYEESIELARAKGPFPRFLAEPYLQSGYARQLPERLRDDITRHGVRNVTLLTVAPTGTTGTMMGTSTGIEPYFLFRFESRSRLGAHVVSESVVADYCREMGLPPDAPLPPQFQTTEDLTPRQHAEVMAVAQRYVDAAISKTCNLPNQFTVEDVKAFYRELYRLGCKGGTVYRDGSRQEQALVKLPAAGGTAAWRPGDASANLVKPLPDQPREGWTHSLLTPLGRVHVTLNLDPLDGSPFDIFIALSKAGSDIDADTDAIGRLLSLLLRLNVDIPSRARLELAIDQIRGIATSRSAGLGPQRVRSVPDGIARCLEELLKFLDRPHPTSPAGKPEGNGTAPAASETNGEDAPAEGAEAGRRRTYMQVCPACGNATAAYVDGCFKCFACGYSEC